MIGSGACLSERPRPSPPVLSVTLDQAELTSPDTLTGSVRAEDRDGIDSIWVTLETDRTGQDGFFEAVVVARFRFFIPAGMTRTTALAVRLEARDVTGFRTTLDTVVVVVP